MDQGNTAFVLFSAALVLLMTPGLAFFYGGMVKAKSVVSMMMLSWGSLGLVGVLWVIYGYAVSFASSDSPTFIGIPGWFGIDTASIGLNAETAAALEETASSYPTMAFVAFQATFAIITVALISGAIADRAKFGAWMIFAGIWATIVYFPVANWVFNYGAAEDNSDGGWLVQLGVIDFAGGTAVHINAGAAGLALALVLGKRFGFSKGITQPHNVPLTLLGVALLWFGWFGFNAGSELGADGVASIAFINTLAAPSAAMLGWVIVEKIRHGKATSIGAGSGAVAGLVAITPACASLDPIWGMVLGVIAGALCALAIDLKFALGFDDSLDVVGIHLVGGIVGTLFIGAFGRDVGFAFGNDFSQLAKQAVGAGAVLVYSFVIAFAIGWIIEKTIGFRVKAEDEIAGIDTVVHGEEAYAFGADKG
ncbi:MAG: ammonium transporter [Rhodoluna sp.]|jgi:Amt family ammonium transporter|nr:ammonium transporter [Rhodoluna sp.]